MDYPSKNFHLFETLFYPHFSLRKKFFFSILLLLYLFFFSSGLQKAAWLLGLQESWLVKASKKLAFC